MRGHWRGAPQISVPFRRLNDLFKYYAKHSPDAAAILAPQRAALTYSGLFQQIGDVGCALRGMGVSRDDRVAVMLPNGPELAVGIFAVASHAACAVVNPGYSAEELERYFKALRLHALMLPAGIDSTARRVALARGIRIIEVSTESNAPAGRFLLRTDHVATPSPDPTGPGGIALFVPTSGTTARSKIVPLTHANVCTSAYSSVASVALTNKDRCLNVLPLFHCHGLIATVLTALATGAGVVCAPGCDVNNFFGWLHDFDVRWYSAVPTMHQAILSRARHGPEQLQKCRLRLIRSASAPLPPRVFAELEQTLATSVLEFYGMTETAGSPIACNPPPPRRRKPGSCGKPLALDVAIMGEAGDFLSHGRTGQVVVRGAAVCGGYWDDSSLTHQAFVDDWFNTGDLGYFDDEGYLFLAGRSREVINRGGEKIMPRQVDEVLLQHPSVAEAVTFAIPHPTLGEDVGSAVVLQPQAAATPKDIRQFALAHLAAFKVPRQVQIVAEIPKGPTGKVQRVGLAAKLGLTTSTASAQPAVNPRTPAEKAIAEIWAEVLQVEQVGLYDNFFALGGDSLLATRVLIRLHEIAHVEVEASHIFEAPTVAELAERIETLIPAAASQTPLAIDRVPRPNGSAPASIAQERLWELHQVLTDLPFFNILYALRLTSRIDVTILERSINEIVWRHEILRTTFAVRDGQCMQVIAPQLTVPLTFHDFAALGRSKKEALAHKLVQQEALHTFDLAKGPLIRVCLLRLDSQEHLLLISAHQAICDGWSLGVFVDELVTLYDAFSARKASPLSPPPIQFADFAHWQRAWRSHPEMHAQLAYWQEQLRGPLPSMRLAVSRTKRTFDDLRTLRRAWALPASLAEAARRFSTQEAGTLFMGLVAALKTMLHHYLCQDDVRVATNVANRGHPETEGLIGPLVNTVVLGTSLAGNPDAREVLRRVRTTCLAAFANQDLPIEHIEESLDKDHVKPAPLANVMILLQNAVLRPAAGLARTLAFEEANADMLMPIATLTTFDIILMLRESCEGLTGTCAYKPHLFSARMVDRLLRDFEAVLEQMVMHPARPISTIRVSFSGRELNRWLRA